MHASRIAWYGALLATAWAVYSCPAVAAEISPTAADRFNAAYKTLVQADKFREQNEWAKAAALYHEALQSYENLSKKYPDWQPGVVAFRISYCNNQLDAIVQQYERGRVSTLAPSAVVETASATLPDSRPIPVAGDAVTAGRALLINGDAENARAALLEGLRSDPDNPRIRLLLATAQCRAGKFDDAILISEQLVADAPTNAVAHLVLGTAHFGLGQIAEAERALRQTLELDPRSAEANFNMAQVLLCRTPPDIRNATRYYQSALHLGCVADPELEKKLGL